MRRHALPLNELNVSPAVRASSREKGLLVSSGGMHGVLPMRTRMPWAPHRANPAC